jgi:hypothetical protein
MLRRHARGLGRMQDAVEPVCARPGDPLARKPEGDLLLQGGRCRLSWQQVIGKPASEAGLGRLVDNRDREVALYPPSPVAGRIAQIACAGAKADPRPPTKEWSYNAK